MKALNVVQEWELKYLKFLQEIWANAQETRESL